MYVYAFIYYFKELAHMIMEDGRSKICSSHLKVVCWKNSLLLRDGQTFVLVRVSSDYMRPTHILKGNLLHSKSTDFFPQSNSFYFIYFNFY